MIKIKHIKKKDLITFVQIWNEDFLVLTSSRLKLTLNKALDGFESKMFDYLGLYKNETLIGFILLKEEKDLWIKHLAISKNYRGRGYGKKLLSYIINRFGRKNKTLKAEIVDSNKTALNFFFKNDFKILKFDKANNQYILNY